MTNKLNISPLLMNRINTTSPSKTGNQQAQTNSISPVWLKGWMQELILMTRE